MKKKFVQYGCGARAIKGFINFDASPTLRIQKMPIIGSLLRPKLNCIFDNDVIYGDIVKGLPLKPNSVDFLFCSHVLEHLTYSDFQLALRNSYSLLTDGGVFRLIVPDLKEYVMHYISKSSLEKDLGFATESSASFWFMQSTCLGSETSRSTIYSRLISAFGNSSHLWMWDRSGLTRALINAGFVDVEPFQKGQAVDSDMCAPEGDHMFTAHGLPCLALQCIKPFSKS